MQEDLSHPGFTEYATEATPKLPGVKIDDAFRFHTWSDGSFVIDWNEPVDKQDVIAEELPSIEADARKLNDRRYIARWAGYTIVPLVVATNIEAVADSALVGMTIPLVGAGLAALKYKAPGKKLTQRRIEAIGDRPVTHETNPDKLIRIIDRSASLQWSFNEDTKESFDYTWNLVDKFWHDQNGQRCGVRLLTGNESQDSIFGSLDELQAQKRELYLRRFRVMKPKEAAKYTNEEDCYQAALKQVKTANLSKSELALIALVDKARTESEAPKVPSDSTTSPRIQFTPADLVASFCRRPNSQALLPTAMHDIATIASSQSITTEKFGSGYDITEELNMTLQAMVRLIERYSYRVTTSTIDKPKN